MTIDIKYRILQWIINCRLSEKTLSYCESKYIEFFPDINTGTLEAYFRELSSKGIIQFGVYAEDGFEAEFDISEVDNDKLLAELDCVILEYQEQINQLNAELGICKNTCTSILTFDPNEMSATLQTAGKDIMTLKKAALTNDMFKTLMPTIEKMEEYVRNVNSVNSSYVEVYKHIVKPIKEESTSGVRATVKWAIISIIITTIISITLNIISK
ncbi:MAG TPA: hypothetical protein VN370_02390 [Desulfitobacteriaceae bacterium]|nr:hypothetical protein [Desulfitobacteriaceae bacterium]